MVYTPTQTRILHLLADGRPHSREELLGCLADELSTRLNLNYHLSTLRKPIRELGEDIVCVLLHKRIYYQHVKMLRVRVD